MPYLVQWGIPKEKCQCQQREDVIQIHRWPATAVLEERQGAAPSGEEVSRTLNQLLVQYFPHLSTERRGHIGFLQEFNPGIQLPVLKDGFLVITRSENHPGFR